MIPRFCSFSQLKYWHQCRRQWAYKFRDGYKPKQPTLDFMRGSLLHKGMEYLLRAGDTDLSPNFEESWKMAVAAWEKEWSFAGDDMIVDPNWFEGCRTIVLGAHAEFRRHWRMLEDRRGPLLECRFYCDLAGWKGLVFVPDVVAEKLTDPFKGGVFGVDFKSFGKPKPDSAGELDLQGAIYQRGLRGKGFEAIGTCLFQLATDPPKIARINKDGTTHKGDEQAILSWKPVKGEIVTYRSPEFLDGVWDQIVQPTADEMRLAEEGGGSALIPNLDYYNCNYCDYREPCLARLKGHDEASILAEQYNKRGG